MEPSPELRAHPAFAGLNAQQIEQLENYLALLVKWNARVNLTAVREPTEIVDRHFAESIFAARQIPSRVKTLLDFGSGAGLPGIPIAIARPEIGVTLAESQNKKAAFLREAVRTLGLKTEVWAARVEEMAPEHVFDAVTLRAVDKMAEACRTAVDRLVLGGWIAVFATRKTEPAVEGLVGIRWEADVAIPGSEQGILKMGVRA
ncbi:MAG TPA: 16S rRNA (guanine(527)-N(7))-methyltransferase RsmG [Acidobacteriaceae bacterium]|jgi:16S rRNA (guanine527-N7)-methyltransferase|nr:16S rRNA (guanine(527)-N(7))-methyltransferase RsmG [Acidobacteriaceae bacterium]